MTTRETEKNCRSLTDVVISQTGSQTTKAKTHNRTRTIFIRKETNNSKEATDRLKKQI